MAVRAADNADAITARIASLQAERRALDEAMARGCHERAADSRCGVPHCPICHPDAWLPKDGAVVAAAFSATQQPFGKYVEHKPEDDWQVLRDALGFRTVRIVNPHNKRQYVDVTVPK